MSPTRTLLFGAALALAGCAHTQARVAAPGAKQQLEACHALLDAKKLDEANRCLEPLERAGGRFADRAAYDHVTALLYQGDFARAASVFAAMVRREHDEGRGEHEAMGYNAITWLRWAEHDLDGAIASNERVRETIEGAAKVSDDDKRDVLLHYWWDRAYLLLDDAEDCVGLMGPFLPGSPRLKPSKQEVEAVIGYRQELRDAIAKLNPR